MTLIHTDGFQLYDGSVKAAATKKWDATTGSVTWPTSSNGRWGAGSGCITMPTSSAYVRKTFTTTYDYYTVGFAIYATSWATATTSVMTWNNTSATTIGPYLQVSTTGALSVLNATLGNTVASSIATLPTSTWTYIEMSARWHASLGQVIVNVNGANALTSSAGWNFGSVQPAILQFGMASTQAAFSVADLYVQGGSSMQTMWGDSRIETLYPAAEGNYTQFTLGAGSTKTAAVNERLYDSDTSYISSSTSGHRQTYTLDDLASSSGTVRGVHAMAILRKEASAPRSVATMIRGASTDVDGTASYVGDALAYETRDSFHETKPGGGSWTISDVNALEAGVYIQS